MISRRSLLAAGCFLGAYQRSASASDGPAILTVKGKIKTVPDGQSRSFDFSALNAMKQTAFTTASPWHKQPTRFEGVSLDDFLASVGTSGTKLVLTALNDYSVTSDIADFKGTDALLSIKQDGHPMTVAENGPVFIMFPFDQRPALQRPDILSRAVWQLCSIEIM